MGKDRERVERRRKETGGIGRDTERVEGRRRRERGDGEG